jgi:hypothetical protein
MRARIRTQQYSIRTEEAYADWVRRFILFHEKKQPKDLGVKEVEVNLESCVVWLGFG